MRSKLLASIDREKDALQILLQTVTRSEALSSRDDLQTVSILHDYACLLAEHDGSFSKAEKILSEVLSHLPPN